MTKSTILSIITIAICAILVIILAVNTDATEAIETPTQITDTRVTLANAPIDTSVTITTPFGSFITPLTPEEIEQPQEPIEASEIVFIGNSLTYGMELQAKTTSQFVCKGGVTFSTLDTSPLHNMQFKAAVINMGTNELGGYSESRYKESYRQLILLLQSINPDVRIFCCSVPPIFETGEYAPQFNNTNAKLYSQYTKEVAEEFDVYYIDNAEFFGDELDRGWSSDGIHFGGTTYKKWYDWLVLQVNSIK
ncbi:MAG: SGNH/GDSL hydrolase family protein [Agathobacter sp.]|nr:SGNH/GDSL hydrolase family protein [Agathobacter sp.]